MTILVTGGTGMVGQALKKELGCINEPVVFVGSEDYELKSTKECRKMFLDIFPDKVIHLAAKVGGIVGNSKGVADFYTTNTLINTNVLNEARICGVDRLVSVLSTCVYPDENFVTYPLTEDQLHGGPPHPSNFGYAYAKRGLEVQTRAINQQYGMQYRCVIANNLYGPHDNFNLESGHVIPSMLRKILEAKWSKSPSVGVWGSGMVLREFTFSEDLARILVDVLYAKPFVPTTMNVGNTEETLLFDVISMLIKFMEYGGEIRFDHSKPDGQRRKPSSNLLFREHNPGFQYTSLEDGLKKTCEWFKNNYPCVRGM